MRLGLGHSLARRGFVATAIAAGPEAAYIAAITAAGATVSAPQQAAVSTFMAGEIAAGRWDGHKRIHFPVWGLAAANAICMKSLTSGTFTGGFSHTSRGARSNSLRSHFKIAGQFLAPLGISKSSYHISYMVTDNMTSDYAYDGFLMQGANTSPAIDFECRNSHTSDDNNIVEFVGVDVNFFDGSTTTIKCSDFNVVTEPMGIISCNGNGSTQYIKHRNVLGVSTKSTNSLSQSGILSGLSLTFMGSQYQDNVAPVTCGLLTLGTHMTSEQDSLFTTALKALWENVTGQSLPTL